jgi:hypothetical protein
MAIDVLVIREGNHLVACDSLSLEAIQTIKKGEAVTAVIRRNRNPKHHRKLFALLNVVFEAQSSFATTYELLTALKMATGLFETGKTVEGIPFAVPKSINFSSMCQNDFEEWYKKAVDVILTKILPNVNKYDLEAQVMEILEGNQT